VQHLLGLVPWAACRTRRVAGWACGYAAGGVARSHGFDGRRQRLDAHSHPDQAGRSGRWHVCWSWLRGPCFTCNAPNHVVPPGAAARPAARLKAGAEGRLDVAVARGAAGTAEDMLPAWCAAAPRGRRRGASAPMNGQTSGAGTVTASARRKAPESDLRLGSVDAPADASWPGGGSLPGRATRHRADRLRLIRACSVRRAATLLGVGSAFTGQCDPASPKASATAAELQRGAPLVVRKLPSALYSPRRCR
jgi:hypothetical protein